MSENFDVFISYRRDDGRKLAEGLYHYLKDRGLRVFYDKDKNDSIPYSTDFQQKLEEGIRSAPHYVLIGTTGAFESEWVKWEMRKAVEYLSGGPGRTLSIIQAPGAEIPEKTGDEAIEFLLRIDRIYKYPHESDEALFDRFYDVARRVSPETVESAARRWFENSKLPGGRFARLDISETILPRAGERRQGEMLPIKVGVGEKSTDPVPLADALKQTEGHLFLIGEGGIGKTTALMKLMQDRYADGNVGGPIPVFIELSSAPDSGEKVYEKRGNRIVSTFILRSVYKQIVQRGSRPTAEEADLAFRADRKTAVDPIEKEFKKETPRPEYLLLLDGLNEVPTAKVDGSSDSVLELIRLEIQALLKCPNVRVILTSRSDDVSAQYDGAAKLFLSGIDENSIKSFLEAKQVSIDRIGKALADERLRETLGIPLFLTMYAKLKNEETVSTRGEIMRCFFHERSENIDAYTAQGRVADVGTNVTGPGSGVLTADMQNFILELILPGIGCEMEKKGLFRLSGTKLGICIENAIEELKKAGIAGRYARSLFRIKSRSGAAVSPNEMIRAMDDAFGGDQEALSDGVIACLRDSLGIMFEDRDGEYGFIHQHIRDYFAAVRHIHAMRLACALQKDGEADAAQTVMDELFFGHPVGIEVRRFIGEALGEHYNAPAFENGAWRAKTPSNDPDRSLLTRTLGVYRGRKRDEAGYGVYSLVHIINETCGELSGIDFSGIDFTGCSLNGMRLSRKGVEARFENAVLSYNELGFMGHTGAINSAQFSPDGKRIVTASWDCTAKIWDAESFQLLGTLKGHSGIVNSAVFSPDGKMIVTASGDGSAKVWDAESFRPLGTLEGHSGSVLSAAFNQYGSRIVTASGDNTAKIWDAKSFQLLFTLEGHSDYVNSASFNPVFGDSCIVTASNDNTAKIWDAESFRLLCTLQGHSGAVKSASFSPDGKRIVTASRDGTAKIWDAESSRLLGTLEVHSRNVFSATYSPDGKRILTRSSDETLKIWSAQSLCLLGMLDVGTKAIRSAEFSPDGKRIVTASYSGAVKIWDAESFQLLGSVERRSFAVLSAELSPDGKKIVAASLDHSAKVWSARSFQLLGILEGHSESADSAAFSPSGCRIVTASADNTAKVWDTESFRLLGTLEGHSRAVKFAAFSPDSRRIVTASSDKTAKVWDAESFQPLGTFKGHSNTVNSAAFSPDGKRIVTTSWDGTAKICDAESLSLHKTFEKCDNQVFFAAYSPDGNRIVTGSYYCRANVWDAQSLKLLGSLKWHSDSVRSAAFSPDGKRIVTASFDCTARIWDAESCQLLATLGGHSNTVNSASFSPDGSVIVTASSDGTVKLWNAEPDADGKCECLLTLPNVPGLNFVGVDFSKLAPGCEFTGEQKELLRMYGAKI